MRLLCFRGRLFIVALWSPAGKGLTSWLSFVMSNCELLSHGILGQVWYLIPDICPLSYFDKIQSFEVFDKLKLRYEFCSYTPIIFLLFILFSNVFINILNIHVHDNKMIFVYYNR